MKKSVDTLAKSSFILIFSTALVKIISALFKIPLASDLFLGDIGFGYFSIAHDLYMPFYLLAITGLPIAVSHIIAEKTAKNLYDDIYISFYSCKRLFIFSGLICCGILLLISLPLLLMTNGDKSSYLSIFAIIPSIFLCFIISAYRGYFEGFSNMNPTAISKIIEALIKFVFGLLFSYLIINITGSFALASAGAITAITLGTAVSTLYLYIKFKRCNKIIPKKYNFTKKNNLSLFFKLALPFVIASLTASFVALLDIFTVKIPLDFAQKEYINKVVTDNCIYTEEFSVFLYGIRSKAFTIYNLIPTFTAAIGVGALPILTSLYVEKDIKQVKYNINYTIKLISVITLPAAIGLFTLSGRIMELLYSSSDILSSNILKIYGIAAIFSGLTIPSITILQALGKQRTVIFNIIVSIIIKIISSLIFVSYPSINILSAALSTLACYLYLGFAVGILLYKEIGKLNIINSIIKPLIASIICGITAYGISLISTDNKFTLLAILLSVMVYFLVIILTKTFTKNEIMQFPFIKKLIPVKK